MRKSKAPLNIRIDYLSKKEFFKYISCHINTGRDLTALEIVPQICKCFSLELF